jgi:ubiquinone/menaquinone biosynthesis C-methylase UbiE
MGAMALSREQILNVYRRRAGTYDRASNLYYLTGFRLEVYRRRAVASLGLKAGDTVVDVGCGTGLDFSLLERAVGPAGRIIGVDMTDAMLARARERVRREGWLNVELVSSDVAEYSFPAGVSGILSTLALTLMPEFDLIIARGARALAPGRRWVIADLKMPGWPGARVAARLLVPLYRPFAVTLDLAERHPWESMARYLKTRR